MTRFIGKKTESIAKWAETNRKNAKPFTKWTRSNHKNAKPIARWPKANHKTWEELKATIKKCRKKS